MAVVPAFVLAVVGGSVTRGQYTKAGTIADVQSEAAVLSNLTGLRQALLAARAPVEVEVRASVVGVDEATALDLLGLDAPTAPDLDAVADRLMALPADARPFTPNLLRTVRTAAERAPDVSLIDAFDRLDTLARDQWERRLVRLRAQVVASGSTTLNEQLDDLEASTRASTAATTRVTKLAEYWFATVTKSDRAGPALAAISSASDQFQRAVASLEASTDPAVAQLGRSFARTAPRTRFDAAIADAIAGRPPAPFARGIDRDLVAATFRSSFDLFTPLLDAMEARSARLDAVAAHLAQDATRTARLSLAGLIASLLLLLAACLAVASSLDGPLGRLIDGIRRVGDGDLDARTLPLEGPTEFAEATRAFNDVVLNLNRIEGKVAALAEGSLDDVRLAEPLPGSLGESMDHWISTLSASLAARNELQVQLTHQATHDSLTHLPNRAGALSALDQAIARATGVGHPVVVLFLDLDGFKAVNDTFGHQTGDEALCEVARRIDDEARNGDVCARLGGDEFLIVGANATGTDGALALARRIVHRIAEPFALGPGGRHHVHLGVSIGIASLTSPAESPASMIARADAAAYRAKRAGSSVELAFGIAVPERPSAARADAHEGGAALPSSDR
ncbi:MAG: diguanylate cyclase domain-containing protein [Aquihabitans sp.]